MEECLWHPNLALRTGEIRIGCVADTSEARRRHEYVGVHPYLIVSNNIFNEYSDVVAAIPFTSRKGKRPSPAHVFFKKEDVVGLTLDSTLMCENETLISKDDLSECIARLSDEQMAEVAKAYTRHKPWLLGVPMEE